MAKKPKVKKVEKPKVKKVEIPKINKIIGGRETVNPKDFYFRP